MMWLGYRTKIKGQLGARLMTYSPSHHRKAKITLCFLCNRNSDVESATSLCFFLPAGIVLLVINNETLLEAYYMFYSYELIFSQNKCIISIHRICKLFLTDHK